MLADKLKTLLASVFSLRVKTQYYHWNVEGPNFSEYHSFFGDLYSKLDGNIDTIAEHIRALGQYAPGSLSRFTSLTVIEDETEIPNALEMLKRISNDNIKIHQILTDAHADAEEEKQRGVINFLEGLLDENEKTQWMLNSYLKK